MGLFDLRCALSGLSLSSRTSPESFRCAMVLFEEVDGRLVPLVPPVSGHYDRYGRIELWGDDAAEAANAAWVGTVLTLLWEAGVLQSDAPAKLKRHVAQGTCGGGPAPFLAHVAESVHDGVVVRVGGHRVVPCIYREDVAAAIAEVTAPDQLAAEPPRLACLDDFGPPPAATFAALARFGRVLQWAARHGGLRPIAPGGDQHDDADFDRFAREAYARDPVLRDLLARWHRRDMAALDARRELEAPPVEAPTPPFDLAMVGAVLAARGVAPGERAEIVGALTAAPDPARVARMLAATPPSAPAVLADTDGVIQRNGDHVTLRNPAYPDTPVEYVLRGRTVRVRDGETVVAGAPLTDGEADPQDQVRIVGAYDVAARMSAELGALLGRPAAWAEAVVHPMFALVRIVETGQRVSKACWDAWFDAGEIDEALVADPVIAGYPTLVRHADPALADVRAARAKRRALVAQRGDPDRYYLPRDLAG